MGRIRNRIHRNRTYVRFIFSFLATLCLPIMCFTYIFLQDYREVYRDKIIEQAENSLDTTGMELDRYIGSLWMTIFNENLNIDMEKAVLNETDYYATEVSDRLRDSLSTHYILSNVCYYSQARPDTVYTVSGIYALPYYERIYMGAEEGERLSDQLEELGRAGWMVWKQGTSLQYAIETSHQGHWIFTISNEDLGHILSRHDSYTVLKGSKGEDLFATGQPDMERCYEMAFDSPNGYFRLVRYMDEGSLFEELNALQRYFYLVSVLLLLIGGALISILTYYNGYPFRKLLEYSREKVTDIPESMEVLEAFQFALKSMEEQIAQAESKLRENQDAVQVLLDIREQYEAYIRHIRGEHGDRSGNEEKEGKERAKKDDIVIKITAYIDENRKSSDLCVSMVADYFNMSVSNMSHRFKKQTGRTISDYITEKKFGYVCELLSETDYSIKEIASRAGYSHPVSFIYKFKQLYGMTPVEYRTTKR